MCGDRPQIYHCSDSKSLVPSREFSLLWEALHHHSSSPNLPPRIPMILGSAPEHGCLSSPAFSTVFVCRA